MSKLQHLKESLLEVAALLRRHHEADRADTFARLAVSLADPPELVTAVMDSYAGAGSFTDLVLHRNGDMLSAENHDLARLRDRLWDAAIAVLVAEEHAHHADELARGMIERIRRIRQRYGCSLTTAKEIAIVADGSATSLRDHVEHLLTGLEAELDAEPGSDPKAG